MNQNNGNYNGNNGGQYHRFTPKFGIDLRGAADIPWGAVVIVGLIAWYIGVILVAAKMIGTSQQKEAIRQQSAYIRSLSGSPGRPEQRPEQQPQPQRRTADVRTYGINSRPAAASSTGNAAPAPQATARTASPTKQEKKKEPGTFGATVLIVLGVIALIVGLVTLPDPIGMMISYGFSRVRLADALNDLVWVLCGGGMLFWGNHLKKRARLWKKIMAIVGKKDNMYIEDICRSVNSGYKETCDSLEGAIDRDYFGPDAYLDMNSRSLVVRGEAPAPREDTAPKTVRTEPAPGKDPAVAKEESEYASLLRQLREVNLEIPGEEMTAKISRLEVVTARIFEIAEKDPSKLPQMRRFMDYYLPTSLKLLKQYAEFDRQGVSGEYIGESKQKIEETMDTLVTGFEQQLDKLFQSDALDVSTDIDVLKNMMVQDGLDGGENDPFKLG